MRSSSSVFPFRILIFFLAMSYFLLVGSYFFMGAGRDDCFITYWSALQFASGKGLVNYNYEPCEVSSSLLHVICLAAIHKISQIDIFVIGRFFGVAMGLACVLLGVLRSSNKRMAALFSVLLLSNQSFLYWSFGGLETTLFAFTLFAYVLALCNAASGGGWICATLTGFMALISRPEGFIVILIGASTQVALRLFSKENMIKGILSHLVWLVGFFAMITISRYILFDSLFPNPVLAKTEISLFSLKRGFDYVCQYAAKPWILFGLVTFCLFVYDFFANFVKHRSDVVSVVLGTAIFGYFCFIVLSGGDWMEYGRFFVPIAPCLAYAGAYGTDRLLKAIGFKIIVFAGLIQILACLMVIKTEPGNCSTVNPRLITVANSHELMMLNWPHRRDLINILPYIRNYFARDLEQCSKRAVVYAWPAGFFPYMLRTLHPDKRFSFLDACGLTEPGIAKLDTKRSIGGVNAGFDVVGTLSGSHGQFSRYVRDREPCIIYFVEINDKLITHLKTLGYGLTWSRPLGNVFNKEGLDQQ